MPTRYSNGLKSFLFFSLTGGECEITDGSSAFSSLYLTVSSLSSLAVIDASLFAGIHPVSMKLSPYLAAYLRMP